VPINVKESSCTKEGRWRGRSLQPVSNGVC
jgi:hypothetical protein